MTARVGLLLAGLALGGTCLAARAVASAGPALATPPLHVQVNVDAASATWSAPRRIHDDAENAWQWFGTLAVAPNGRLDAVWNDTRGTGSLRRSRLHYASSYDGGDTWSAGVAIGPEWDSHVGWPSQSKIGDYDCNANGVPDQADIA